MRTVAVRKYDELQYVCVLPRDGLCRAQFHRLPLEGSQVACILQAFVRRPDENRFDGTFSLANVQSILLGEKDVMRCLVAASVPKKHRTGMHCSGNLRPIENRSKPP